jgi:hypothetical protein
MPREGMVQGITSTPRMKMMTHHYMNVPSPVGELRIPEVRLDGHAVLLELLRSPEQQRVPPVPDQVIHANPPRVVARAARNRPIAAASWPYAVGAACSRTLSLSSLPVTGSWGPTGT